MQGISSLAIRFYAPYFFLLLRVLRRWREKLLNVIWAKFTNDGTGRSRHVSN